MLSNLTKLVEHRGKRHGRGIGSGKGGHTTGRGTKGQKARSGDQSPRPGFEGGQMPLSRRLPKLKGFSREFYHKKSGANAIDIKVLEVFKADETVSVATLIDKGIVSKAARSVKVIGNAALTKKLNFEGINFSASAKSAVEKAGGVIK